MIALLIAAALIQSAPDAAATPAPTEKLPSLQLGGLPKDDYGLVAWCHGAVAGQLELDPIVKADMEKIEGKSKVAARAASDAEMEKERRAFLKDYEHALAAAEAASPNYIHETGVRAEERGYGMWTATRNKASIWRMLDWGMWDPNDVGCNDAAKRLYEKSKLFGEALKGADAPSDPTPTPAPPAEAPKPAEVVAELKSPDADASKNNGITSELKPQPADAGVQLAPTADARPADTQAIESPPAPAVAETAATPPPAKKVKKVAVKAVAAKKKLSMDSSAEEIRDAIARGKVGSAAPKDDPPATPAQAEAAANPPALRGPQ